MLAHLVGDSRLVIPPLPPRHLPRPALVRAVNAASGLPLTLVSAGPGAGKTVLIAEWARQTADRVAWMTLSQGEASGATFWRMFAAALRQSDPVSSLNVSPPHWSSDSSSSPRPVDDVHTWIDGLDELSGPTTIVIDGGHLITDPDVLVGLDSVLQAWEPNLRVVIIARSDPLLPLHRYRLAGMMAELRGDHLAMHRSEVARILADRGVALPPDQLEELLARTEGWVAGVCLAAMRMETMERPTTFLSQLALDKGSIGEYLLEEVILRQPESVRRMLVETSFLDEVTGPLASAITGIDGCAEMLSELSRTNSFVLSTDASQSRFRYHQLLGNLLGYLRRRAPGDPKGACTRASAWFEGEGDLSTATFWALRGDDPQRSIRLLTHGALAHAFVTRQDVSGWDLNEASTLENTPAPLPDAAGDAATAGRVVRALLADGEGAARALDEFPREASLDPGVDVTCDLARLILGQRAGRPESVRLAASRLLERDPRLCSTLPGGLRPAVLLAQALAEFWEGHGSEAVLGLLEQGLGEAERIGDLSLQVETLAAMSLVHAYWSRPHRAEEVALRARSVIAGEGFEIPVALDLADAFRCMAAADQAGAKRALERAQPVDLIGADPGFGALRDVAQATLLVVAGHHLPARALLQNAPRYLAPPLQRAYADSLLATIETALDRPRAALHILERYTSDRALAARQPESEMAYLLATARARAYIALGDLQSASLCVTLLLSSPNAQVGRYHLVEGMMCAALISDLRKDEARAIEMVVRALQLAGDDIVLPIVQMTEALGPLLSRHPTLSTQWPRLARERIEFDRERSALRGLPEPLTERERAVLRLLTTSMSTTEIAGEMFVSVNTVKTHLAAIYRKLAASKRREAVLRARELELL